MGLDRTFLIAVVALFFWVAPRPAAAKTLCLNCHKPHYEAVGSCIGCHRGNEKTNRIDIAHHNLIPARFAYFTIAGTPAVERGRKLVEMFACRRCHTTAGKGNRLATDLDLLFSARTPQQMFTSIRSPVLFMPDFRFDDRQITDLVNALLAGGKGAGEKRGETPLVVHFEEGRPAIDNGFVKLCGPCHKALTKREGGVGKGEIGPNLSGLFSPFYPRTFRDRESWSVDRLRTWIENPRRVRANAQMQPIRLKGEDFGRLLETLQ